ncbi:hypothetical protein [Flectobacillus major]|uniref:hypothetical protein n=1 Tax=Flectobacillus major TaxID=103 RepID=UPI000429B050|nr:hypothetical protein [Flectobacillus major]
MENTSSEYQEVSWGENTYVPFVNEECGDSLWDEVLKEKEALEAKVLAIKEQ